MIYLLYQKRVQRIRKEEEKKTAFNKKLAEVEMKALRAQMNPHFIFNCMNSIESFILSRDEANASRYLHKFSKLIRLILENSMHPVVPITSDLEALSCIFKWRHCGLMVHSAISYAADGIKMVLPGTAYANSTLCGNAIRMDCDTKRKRYIEHLHTVKQKFDCMFY
jgi:hypothetical protein